MRTSKKLNTSKGFGEFYKKDDPWNISKDKSRLKFATRFLTKRELRVLDIRCCLGGLFEFVPKGPKVFDVDTSQLATKRAKLNYPNADLGVVDVRNFHF